MAKIEMTEELENTASLSKLNSTSELVKLYWPYPVDYSTGTGQRIFGYTLIKEAKSHYAMVPADRVEMELSRLGEAFITVEEFEED